MQCSLFGKLQERRDFIAVGAPREFLNAWEPWLQSAISSSRHELGKGWQSAFLAAPIWRFWLGADVCGRTVMGAFMSSLDGVGRYFPLTLFACADDNAAIPPPELNPQDNWFDSVEALLLSTLEPGTKFEEITDRLDKMPAPFQQASESPGRDSPHDSCFIDATGRNFAESFGEIRVTDHRKLYAGSTFWWTIGGDQFRQVALYSKDMPDPYLFSAMLTGEFTKD